MSFVKVERTVSQLKRQLEQGTLTRAEVEQRLKELMIQSKDGNWWMLGFDSGKWYRNVEGRWVEAKPPSESAPATLTPTSRPREMPTSRVQPRAPTGQGLNPWVSFLIGCVVGVVLVAMLLLPLEPKVIVETVEVMVTREVEVPVYIVEEVVVTATP